MLLSCADAAQAVLTPAQGCAHHLDNAISSGLQILRRCILPNTTSQPGTVHALAHHVMTAMDDETEASHGAHRRPAGAAEAQS